MQHKHRWRAWVPQFAAAVPLTSAFLLVSSPALAQETSGAVSTDVPPGHWAYGAVQDLASKAIVKGYPDGTFRGQQAMTRYEFAAELTAIRTDANSAKKQVDALRAQLVTVQTATKKAQDTADNSFGYEPSRKFQIGGFIQSRYEKVDSGDITLFS